MYRNQSSGATRERYHGRAVNWCRSCLSEIRLHNSRLNPWIQDRRGWFSSILSSYITKTSSISISNWALQAILIAFCRRTWNCQPRCVAEILLLGAEVENRENAYKNSQVHENQEDFERWYLPAQRSSKFWKPDLWAKSEFRSLVRCVFLILPLNRWKRSRRRCTILFPWCQSWVYRCFGLISVSPYAGNLQ